MEAAIDVVKLRMVVELVLGLLKENKHCAVSTERDQVKYTGRTHRYVICKPSPNTDCVEGTQQLAKYTV